MTLFGRLSASPGPPGRDWPRARPPACLSTRVNPSDPAPGHLPGQQHLPFWLYLDAEVLVLPPIFYPQDSCFVGRRYFVVNQLPPTRSQFRLLCWCGLSMRGVSVIPRAVSLRVSLSQSTGILGIPLPALLSNMCYFFLFVCRWCGFRWRNTRTGTVSQLSKTIIY